MADDFTILQHQNNQLRAEIEAAADDRQPARDLVDGIAAALKAIAYDDTADPAYPGDSLERMREKAIRSLKLVQANLQEQARALIVCGFADESDFERLQWHCQGK